MGYGLDAKAEDACVGFGRGFGSGAFILFLILILLVFGVGFFCI